jgi:hypothetical protein
MEHNVVKYFVGVMEVKVRPGFAGRDSRQLQTNCILQLLILVVVRILIDNEYYSS